MMTFTYRPICYYFMVSRKINQSIAGMSRMHGTVGFIRVEDITTSTIDMSLIYPIQDDITNSVRTFVPCAALPPCGWNVPNSMLWCSHPGMGTVPPLQVGTNQSGLLLT
jgi:hypothetical protein